MSNFFSNWLRSRRFRKALKQGETQQAQKILEEIGQSGAKLSLLQKLFKKQLYTEQDLKSRVHENLNLRQRVQQQFQELDELEAKLADFEVGDLSLQPNPDFIQLVRERFQLAETEGDDYKLQATGIDTSIFDEFEHQLATHLQEEFSKLPSTVLLDELEKANTDLNKLKKGQDPDYGLRLTPHAYFLRFFLDCVYGGYLAWFLIYQEGLLKNPLNVLDLGAGSGAIAYSLALFLSSCPDIEDSPPLHWSYYSLDKQSNLQFRGLQFWQRFIEKHIARTNAFFRFDTHDLFEGEINRYKIPDNFFDFIVISHCIFSDPQEKQESHQRYQEIFASKLKDEGHVLIIVQDKRLFFSYNVSPSEDIESERELIHAFLGEMGLSLVWYKYLTSTPQRTPMSGSNFARFASENLPDQKYMNPLRREYLQQTFDSNYALDDYIILAQPQP